MLRAWCRGGFTAAWLCWSAWGCGASTEHGVNPRDAGYGGDTIGGGGTRGGDSPVAAASGESGAGASAAGGSAFGGGANGTGGRDTGDCFSPLRNLDLAFDAGAPGCACDPATDRDACVSTIVLSCRDARWQSVEDAPCRQTATPSYTPEACQALGGIPTHLDSSTGVPYCESNVRIGEIAIGSAGWEDGASCCAPGKPLALTLCGGGSGHRCAADEYCAYLEGFDCGRTDAPATCRARPTTCDEQLAPVCGCDGKTYPSPCGAHVQGVGLLYAHACPEP